MKKGYVFVIILFFTAIIIIQGNYVTALNIKIGNTANDLACTDCIGADEIEDIYIFNTGDTMTGNLDMNTNLILNIGHADTDFTTTGGMNIAGDTKWGGGFGSGGVTITNDGSIRTAGNLIIGGWLNVTNVNETNVNGTIRAGIDNEFDIGNATHRFRNLYYATSITGTIFNTSLDTGISSFAEIVNVGSNIYAYGDNGTIVGNLIKSGLLDTDNFFCSDCLNETQIEDIYVLNSGDTITGDLVVDGNITTNYYFEGQPLNGSLGSGIIVSSDNLANCGCINASNPTGLDVLYPDLTVRIVGTDGTTTYCDFPSDTVTVIDDQHSTYYTDNTCTLKSDTFANYFNKDLSPGNYTRLFDVYTKNGIIETLKGDSMIELTNKKTKRIGIDLHHLTIISGFDIQENTFSEFNQTAGEFVYINTIVTTSKLQTGSNGLHIVYQDSGDWQHSNQSALNFTHCEDSATVIPCSDNKYRRYVIYNIGWNGNEFIHELLPQDLETYANVGDCLDIDASPISFTLPAQDSGVANIHHMYCGRRDDVAWNGAFIDLRAGTQGFGATIDTSVFLTIDGQRPLTGDWDVGSFGIDVGGDLIISSLAGTYSNGEAAVCCFDNGTIFVRDGGCN